MGKFKDFKAFADQQITLNPAAGPGAAAAPASVVDMVAQQLQQAVHQANQGQKANAVAAAPNAAGNTQSVAAAPRTQAQQLQALDALLAQQNQVALANQLNVAPKVFATQPAPPAPGAVNQNPPPVPGQAGLPNGVPGGIDPAIVAKLEAEKQQLEDELRRATKPLESIFKDEGPQSYITEFNQRYPRKATRQDVIKVGQQVYRGAEWRNFTAYVLPTLKF